MSAAETKAALRGYVTGADHLQYQSLAEGTVQVSVTHSNLRQRVMELRLDLHTTIAGIKDTLFTYNGTPAEHQELVLYDGDRLVARMNDDSRMLGYYGCKNGSRIHVIDNDPWSLSRNGGLDDVSQVKKYRMTDEDYDKRENTLRAWKRRLLDADPAKYFELFPHEAPQEGEANFLEEASTEGITVGARCEVLPGGKRGTVKWVGQAAALPAGYWVGVQLDEPLGKNDGSVKGKKLFDAPAGYGLVVRPNKVNVGDFPEEEMLWSSDEEDDGAAASAEAAVAEEAEASADVAAAEQAAVAAANARARVRGRMLDDDSDDEL